MASQPINFDDLGGKQISPAAGNIEFSDLEVSPSSGVPATIKAASSVPGAISAAPTGVLPWLHSAENDIRYGTDTTLPGKVLKFLGAPGINKGVNEETADNIAGPIIGPIKAAEGIAETPQHPVMGPIHAVGGVLQTISPALNFVAPEASEAAEASMARTGMLRQAIRPGGKPAQAFTKNVQDAWGAIQDSIAQNGGKIPTTLDEFDNLLKSAKQRIWGQNQELLNEAQNTRPQVKGLLQAPQASVQTGVQQVTGEAPGALIPAETRPVVQQGPAAQMKLVPRSDPGIGSSAASVPERIMGQQPEVGAQAAAVPNSVMGPKTVQGEQFLSGSAHPEMSGQLTNPGVLLTRDTSVLSATRDRLGAVINDTERFSQLPQGEQEAYMSQFSRLNKLLQPVPNVPHGPAIDGSSIADAIEGSIRPRHQLFGSSSVQELQSRANAYRGRRISLSDAEELLQDANREASSWYHSPDPHGPQYQASAAAEASEIRNQLYKQIDQLTKSAPGTAAQVKRTYGALDALHDFTSKRIPVASRQAPLNLAEQIAAGGGGALIAEALLHSTGDVKSLLAAPVPWMAARLAKHVNSPEFLLEHALEPSAQIGRTARAGAAPIIAARPSQRKKTLGHTAADYVDQKYPNFFRKKANKP
jgi:hypothetical protein